MNISNNLKIFLSQCEDLINEGDIESLYGEAYNDDKITTKDLIDLNNLIIKTGIGKIPEAFLLLEEVVGKEGTVHDLSDGWDRYNGSRCKILNAGYLGYYDNSISKKENFNDLTWTILIIYSGGNFELSGVLGRQIKLDEPLKD